MQIRSPQALALIVGCAIVGWSSSAWAVFNGAPANGPASASDSLGGYTWTSSVNPNPAISASTCSWVSDGLTAQGFTVGNGWTINWRTLTGALSIQNYYAYVTTQPTENINARNWGGAGPFNYYGGADIRLNYTPAGADPTGAAVHWIQGIDTNAPLGRGVTFGNNLGGGYYDYLDNGGTENTNPYYDNSPAEPATSTGFVDISGRTQPPIGTTNWQAQAFISTWDPANKIINIYGGGVWWGFNLTTVPEPASLGLLVLGLTAMVSRRARRAA